MTIAGETENSVMVSHPGHLLVAYQAALALQEAGLLHAFETGFYYKDGHWPRRLLDSLPAAMAARVLRQLRRRTHEGLDLRRIRRHPVAEMMSVSIARSRLLSRFASKAMQLRNEYFDAVVGRVVRREHPSAVICYDSCALKTFRAARETGVLCILDQVVGHIRSGAEILSEEARLHPEFADTMGEFASEWVAERCSAEAGMADRVLAASEYVRDTLVAYGVPAARIALCPYGVDVDRFRPASRGEPHPFRILFVGQIGQRKGVKYLLEAFRELDLSDAELVLMGSVAGSGEGLKRYEGSFRHVCHVPYNELPDYYRTADIFVYPSLHEGSALAIYEALASGLPVITTHNSGSVVRNGVEGFIVPIRDVQALRDKILLLYRDKALREQMSVRARARAETYTWQAYRQRLAGIVSKEILGEGT
ncbi:MAG TPA: glycosyltransferase family 4 protein [Gallionella sp.]|nr:glycosyltransferase family 4 protein [Gallionella sp.]